MAVRSGCHGGGRHETSRQAAAILLLFFAAASHLLCVTPALASAAVSAVGSKRQGAPPTAPVAALAATVAADAEKARFWDKAPETRPRPRANTSSALPQRPAPRPSDGGSTLNVEIVGASSNLDRFVAGYLEWIGENTVSVLSGRVE